MLTRLLDRGADQLESFLRLELFVALCEVRQAVLF